MDQYVTLRVGGTVSADAAKPEAMIAAGNLYASAPICSNIRNPRNDARVGDQKMQIDYLAASTNCKQEAQYWQVLLRSQPNAGRADSEGTFT